MEFPDWRTLAERFRLELTRGWDALLGAWAFLSDMGVTHPYQQGRLAPAGFDPLTIDSAEPKLLRYIWYTTRSMSALPVGSADYLTPEHAVFTQDSTIKD